MPMRIYVHMRVEPDVGDELSPKVTYSVRVGNVPSADRLHGSTGTEQLARGHWRGKPPEDYNWLRVFEGGRIWL
jgi:hypothetical protein